MTEKERRPASNWAPSDENATSISSHNIHRNGQFVKTSDHLITFSTFNCLTDNQPCCFTKHWGELATDLTRHMERGIKDGPLWSPAVYPKGKTRANEHVIGITLAVGDFDKGQGYEELRNRLIEHHFEFVLYSTYSSTLEFPKFRAVVPLVSPIDPRNWAETWERINHGLFGGQNDPSTKDQSRAYYTPSCPPGAVRFAEHHEGRWLDPAQLPLVAKPGTNGHKKSEPLPNAIVEGGRNSYLTKRGGALRRLGFEGEVLDAALLAENRVMCKPPLSDAEVLGIARSVERYEPGKHIDDPSLPHINAKEQDLRRITAQAWGALCTANAPPKFFRRGGLAVRLEKSDDDILTISELTPDRMRHEVARVANWQVLDKNENWSPAKPPMYAVKDMLATPNYPLPIVNRIVEVPIFSEDGELQLEPGYSASTRTYYAPPPALKVPTVPDYPTQADVAEAKRLLCDELLGNFPFVGLQDEAKKEIESADKTNAIGLALLPYAREMILGPTPLHASDATSVGSGKGLLLDALLAPALGRNIGIVPIPENEEELRKAITSNLRDGYGAIQFDNANRAIKSATLAAALTATTWRDRMLGKNETFNLPIRCVWTISGNNLTMSTENARRTVRIRLDPKRDKPWERDPQEFTHPNLRSWVAENRSRLVWAALVLIQNWIAKGRPKGTQILGSYEAWAETIGGILEAAGFKMFLANKAVFYQTADVEGNILRQFVEAWWEKHKDDKVKSSVLFEIASEMDDFDLGKGESKSQKTTFGIFLRNQRDKVVGDYCVNFAGKVQRASMWQLTEVKCEPREPREPQHPTGKLSNNGDTPESAGNTNTHGRPEVHEVHEVHMCASCGKKPVDVENMVCDFCGSGGNF